MNQALSLKMIEIVAKGLAHLKKEVVFIGGATVPLYIDDQAAAAPRPTEDVDCIIKITSRSAYRDLEKELRGLGFKNMHGNNVPICRWEYQGVAVDVMPTDEQILGFTNRWYEKGIASAQTVQVSSTTTISIFTLSYFIASKLEAYKGRGKSSLRFSPDFEDIVLALDGCTRALSLLKSAPEEVRQYVAGEFASFDQDDLAEALVAHLGSGAGQALRRKRILDIVTSLP